MPSILICSIVVEFKFWEKQFDTEGRISKKERGKKIKEQNQEYNNNIISELHVQ